MNTATTIWPAANVLQPAIERPTAMRLAETEYQRVTDAVDALQFEDWTRPTDCTEWDVRQLVAHIAGQANLFSTPFEAARQMHAAKARQQPGHAPVDGLTALPSRGAPAPRARRAAHRVASRRPARCQGTPPDSGLRTPQASTGSGGRQRCTGNMVHRLCNRCDPHSRSLDAPPGPRPGNRSRPGADPRPRRRHRRRRCGRVGPPPRPALPTRAHRPCRWELALRHGWRGDRDGCRRLLPGHLWPAGSRR